MQRGVGVSLVSGLGLVQDGACVSGGNKKLAKSEASFHPKSKLEFRNWKLEAYQLSQVSI